MTTADDEETSFSVAFSKDIAVGSGEQYSCLEETLGLDERNRRPRRGWAEGLRTCIHVVRRTWLSAARLDEVRLYEEWGRWCDPLTADKRITVPTSESVIQFIRRALPRLGFFGNIAKSSRI